MEGISSSQFQLTIEPLEHHKLDREGPKEQPSPKPNLVHFTCHRTLLVEGQSNIFTDRYCGDNKYDSVNQLKSKQSFKN